jgi:hypothetical protein
MKILALDASTSYIGWCVAENDNYVDSGLWIPEKQQDVWDKIWNIGEMISVAILQGPYDFVFYERPTGNNKNMDTNLKLGALMYEVIHRSRMLDCGFIEVTATQVRASGVHKNKLENEYKKFTPVYKKDGTINKAAMERMGHEADAIGVWLAGLKRMEKKE